MDVFSLQSEAYRSYAFEELALRNCLLACLVTPSLQVLAKGMITLIGELELADRSQDHWLSRMFFNRTIVRAFIGRLRHGGDYRAHRRAFCHASLGLKVRSHILYLLSLVGDCMSTVAEMGHESNYLLKTSNQNSSAFEASMSLSNPEHMSFRSNTGTPDPVKFSVQGSLNKTSIDRRQE